ncbi:GNAT family N-acetyltransferase [Photobacterium japonica]|uniref:GNAT family N-acetyltransferase n=1 Tax=Photobacterium japonica TaxID=2910235 RepID=UPI003D0A37D8
MDRQKNNIQCEVFFNPDKAWVARVWQSLDQQASGNFFLSWKWIGCWIECFVDNFYLVEARQGSKIVGLGIIVEAAGKTGVGQKKRYYLHRTGVEKYDQIWIEYNDFLLNAACAKAVRQQMMSTVMRTLIKKDIFVVGACDSEVFSGTFLPHLARQCLWETTTYMLDLKRLKAQHGTLDRAISRSARYQIHRSMRQYASLGALTVTTAPSIEDVEQYFDEANPLHVKRWGNKAGQSGFVNPDFMRFHRQMNKRNHDVMAVSKIMAGEHTVGIIYNFHWQGRVYFYLSALNYDLPIKHAKPGLVAHYLLINQALSQDAERYDFMGGSTRYKRTFANTESGLAVYAFQQPTMALHVENTIRDLKHRLQLTD